jgi:acetylornithine deacetylase/succinyl-diaminopimelate desuccinylase-like protein
MSGEPQPTPTPTYDAELGDEAVQHLKALLRIDTTNPPGNETPAAEYLADLLAGAGLAPTLLGPVPSRKSVVARLRGTGEKPPLLLHAHLDVVPIESDRWTHPPFGGIVHDGYLWGRGAIDMKDMAVMAALVLCRLAREGRKLDRDVIFTGVADEEAGCDEGSKWLVDHHPEHFRAEYAVGEVGGATLYLGGRPVYPVQVAEKGVVWMKLKARGTPGHGSIPREDNAVVRLSEAVARLAHQNLPHHPTAAAATYLDALADTQPFPRSLLIRQLLNPKLAKGILRLLPDRSQAALLGAAISNTATPTMLRAGYKTNVIPAEAEAEVDGRSLPGQTAADLVAEVQTIVGRHIEVLVTRDLPPVETKAPSPLFDAITSTMATHHPGASVVPTLITGFTDAKHWSRLGARCYGFCPVRFPEDGPRFTDLFHGHDERIPVEGLRWGIHVLYDFIRRFAG